MVQRPRCSTWAWAPATRSAWTPTSVPAGSHREVRRGRGRERQQDDRRPDGARRTLAVRHPGPRDPEEGGAEATGRGRHQRAIRSNSSTRWCSRRLELDQARRHPSPWPSRIEPATAGGEPRPNGRALQPQVAAQAAARRRERETAVVASASRKATPESIPAASPRRIPARGAAVAYARRADRQAVRLHRAPVPAGRSTARDSR